MNKWGPNGAIEMVEEHKRTSTAPYIYPGSKKHVTLTVVPWQWLYCVVRPHSYSCPGTPKTRHLQYKSNLQLASISRYNLAFI